MGEDSTTLADLADRQLRRDIVAGLLKPGQKLTAISLTKRYGIGASPLREALSRLCADHLVLLEGKRGFTVAAISLADLDDVSRCRRLVEAEAVRLSVCSGDDLWESRVVATFHRLERADKRVRQGTAPGDEEWEQRNRDFHAAVISACGSPWLTRLQHLLYIQHERYRRLSLCQRDPARDLLGEHRAIMQGCLDRDPEAAVRLVSAHIDATAAAVRAMLAQDFGASHEARTGRRRPGTRAADHGTSASPALARRAS
jgi:GntR family carbon starvation induced transcriptional regulator